MSAANQCRSDCVAATDAAAKAFRRALPTLPIAWLLLRTVPYGRLAARLARPPPRDAGLTDADAVALAQETARGIARAARYCPLPTTCLTRSLVLWRLLWGFGIASRMVIGVRKDGPRFSAHAWVETRGVAVNEAPDVRERFRPLEAPLAGAPMRFV